MKDIEIIMDIELALKRFIKETILSLENIPNSTNLKEFKINDETYWDKPIKEILLDYYNYLDRVIFAVPRKVILTKTILNSSYYKQYEIKLNEIKEKFERGISIKEYLSARHRKNYKFKDKTYQLVGLHHMHLGKVLPKGRVERSYHLLMLQIDEEEKKVYFLEILTHSEFDKSDYYKYLTILVKEGLDKFFIELPMIEPSVNDPQEFNDILSNGVNASIRICDKVVMPRSIVAYDGSLVDGGNYAEYVMNNLRSLSLKIMRSIEDDEKKYKVNITFKDIRLLDENIEFSIKAI